MKKHLPRLLAVTLAGILALAARAGADTGSPFISASSGPQASARVEALVTRTIAGSEVTLPAADVPALAPGDRVAIRFDDYRGSATTTHYHTNVAFLTEAAPQHWLFSRSGPHDRLFTATGKHGSAPPTPPFDIRFTYGGAERRGIPVVFLVPEDGKTRGMDGVRDYIEAHPTDFKDMSQSANDAVDRYVWFNDFLTGLAQGSIDPISGQQRVAAVAATLGASQATVAACYTPGAAKAAVADCVRGALTSTQYQPNIEAPTQAQFLGGVGAAVGPIAFASYLQPLLTVWQIFARSGHKEYEYLPTTLERAAHPGAAGPVQQVLAGLKVPTLRPPAAYSSVLFFTIGDPASASRPPLVTSDADAAGICARTPRFVVPLHVDRTSQFLNASGLVVNAGGADRTIPLDPGELDAPAIARAQLDDGKHAAYRVRLSGRFGFDPLRGAASTAITVAIPHAAPWSIALAPHRPAAAGGTLDAIAESPAAPCLSHAEVQVGNGAPIALEVRHLDATRVELTGSLANVPATTATIRFVQDDPTQRAAIEDTTSLAIAAAPARVDAKNAPSVAPGDTAVSVRGTGLQAATALRIGTATFAKAAQSTATLACFVGPPLAADTGSVGSAITGALVGADGSDGDVFAMTLAPKRPGPLAVVATSPTATSFSTSPTTVTVTDAGGPLPQRVAIRVRRAPALPTPCDAVRPDDAAAAVADADVHQVSSTRTEVTLRAGALLGDGAFGTLELQLVDRATNAPSDWFAIPGSFARAPAIAHITCPAAAAAPCALYGTQLATIAGVVDAPGHVAPIDRACASTEKTPCVLVPHLAHYTLRLADDDADFPVPDSALAAPPAAPKAEAPSPAPR